MKYKRENSQTETKFSSPTTTQLKDTVKDGVSSKITHVDSLRRVVKVLSPNGQESFVKIPEGLDHLDLPPNGEGWQAIVKTDNGEPYILAFLAPNSVYLNEDVLLRSVHSDGKKQYISESITDTEEVYRSYKADVGKNYRHDRPTDSLPGDKGFWGVEGNFFGVLRGKLNMSKVSASVQWFQSAIHRLTRIISNRLEVITSWGTIKFQHEDDMVRLEVKAADKHSKARKGTYDAFLEIGACRSGDNFLSFKLIHADNMKQPLTITINNKGECEYTVPETFTKRIAKNEIKGVGKESHEIVGTKKTIEAPIVLIETQGNASCQLGGEGVYPDDTLVKKPHLDKYGELLGFCSILAKTPTLLGVPGLLFFTTIAPDAVKVEAQKPIYINDKTSKAVGQ